MPRQPFQTRTIRLVTEEVRANAHRVLDNIPIDSVKPLEMILREEKKARGLDQNAAMWAGPLADIAQQGWVSGRQYSAEVWHEHFKREYLPEDDDPELPILAKDGYSKWGFTPAGERVLVGSTTQLTRKGMTRYLQQIEAFGASLGVMFQASPRMVA